MQQAMNSLFDATSSHDEDFFDQMLSSLAAPPPSSWTGADLATSAAEFDLDHDLAAKLRQHQIGGGDGAAAAMKSLLLQQQLMMETTTKGLAAGAGGMQFSAGSGMSPMAMGHVSGPPFRPLNSEVDESVQALYNVLAGSLQGNGQASNPVQHLHLPQDKSTQAQSFGTPAVSGSNGGGVAATAATGQPRQRVRARRGQATDPHSIAERLRRERIAERMKALQELVPNANKTDKASMLDEIIDYVKFLQLQVKVLSMSRLGGAAAVAPLVADAAASERTSAGGLTTATLNNNNSNDNVTVTEHQVAKLMEEDMGSAMQYLQGKGLCLMPISLATAISTATGRNPMISPAGNRSDGGGSSSPSLSGLTVQSATLANNDTPI